MNLNAIQSLLPRPIYLAMKSLYRHAFTSIARPLLLRSPGSQRAHRSQKWQSVKVISYYGRQNGISQGAVLQSALFEMLGYSVERIDVTEAMNNPFKGVACSSGDLFVIHCAGPHFLQAAWPLRRVLPSGKVVGYFAWEFADPPRRWPNDSGAWDEIWTPSTFSARALAQWCDCEIKVVPHVFLEQNSTPRKWRKDEEPLMFLTMADARSSLSRKNPWAALKAFQLAFPKERDVELVLKLQEQGTGTSPELSKLLTAIQSDSRVRTVRKTLSRQDVNGLFLASHVFVSLHRAEGFGIPLLEAQTFGLATIATGWSGNLDFTTEENSVLVPYTLATSYDEGGIYGNVTWAEPDIEAAAKAMRSFYDEPSELARVSVAGWEACRPEHQMERFAAAIGHNFLPG